MSTSKRCFKLINNEIIFGEIEVIDGPNGGEILVKNPYTAKGGKVMPYMLDVLMESPKAVQIHPMNVLWSVPLDEFDEVNRVYIQATTGIITSAKSFQVRTKQNQTAPGRAIYWCFFVPVFIAQQILAQNFLKYQRQPKQN